MTDQVSFTVVPEGSVTTPKGFRAGGLHCGSEENGAL